MITIASGFEVPGGHLDALLNEKAIPGVAHLPLEPYERLYLVRGAQRLEVPDLNVLRGKVRISSPEAALAYARLPTAAPRTYYLFQHGERIQIDIVDRSLLTIDFVYGDRMRLHFVKGDPNGFCGILDHHLYRAMGIPPTSVKRQGKDFIVCRPLYSALAQGGSLTKPKAMVLCQCVTSIGGVTDLSSHPLPDRIAKADFWDLLWFE